MVAVSPLSANIVDITTSTTALLHPGDQLIFQFSTGGYQDLALLSGAPLNPTGMQFLFVSEPVSFGPQFSASLESADGSISLLLPGLLSLAPGMFQGDWYSGPVSTISGALTNLPDNTSAALLGGPRATLRLTNRGGNTTLGLSPYRISQDLMISLGDGRLSVGGLVTSVNLQSQVPEPDSRFLLLAGGAILCLLARACRGSKQISDGRIE
jgi:hypothetical protein